MRSLVPVFTRFRIGRLSPADSFAKPQATRKAKAALAGGFAKSIQI